MATRVDALRSTLDQLALDPRAQEDRPYLTSMLRRLGYSDVEIQAALGPEPAPEPMPEAPTRPPRPTPEAGPRVIEVEYTGPEYSEEETFDAEGRRVHAAGGFAIAEGEEDGELSFGLADEEEGYEGEGENFGDFDISAVDNVEAAWDDDWGEGGDFGSALAKREAGGAAAMSEEERRKLMEELGLDPDDADIVDFGDRPRNRYNKPKEVTGKLIAFEEFHPHEAASEMQEAETVPWATDEEDVFGAGTEAEDAWSPSEDALTGDDVQPFGEGEAWEPAEEAWPEDDAYEDLAAYEEPGIEPFRYGDYTLYTRQVELSTGREQSIYFFAREPPRDGEPCGLPEGYEVKENDQTGLPYLRRIPDETDAPAEDEEPEADAPRKRVRAVRVRAASREEAEEMLRQQGKNVRGSVPIDYDEGEEA